MQHEMTGCKLTCVTHLMPDLRTHDCVRRISWRGGASSYPTLKSCGSGRWGCALQTRAQASVQSSSPYTHVPSRLSLGLGSRSKAVPRYQPLLPLLAQKELLLCGTSPKHFCHNWNSFLEHLISPLWEFCIPGFLLCLHYYSLYIDVAFN